MPHALQAVGVGVAATPARLQLSRGIALLAGALVAASFLLLSPRDDATYPGTVPWSKWSILRHVSDGLALWGVFQTERGVEVKDVAFHAAAALGLAILAFRLWRVPGRRIDRRHEAWLHALILLGLWVGLSGLSALWSGDAELTLKRTLLYAIAVGWAAAVAGTLELPHLGRLLTGIAVASSVAAGLTIWYWFERNPHHRPGFPIGNPSVLAANLLPALMIGVAWVAGSIAAWRTRRVPIPRARLFAALLLLGICGGTFALVGSRGGLLGLVLGLATIGFFGLGRRGPLVASLAGIVIVLAAGFYFYSGRMGDTMARGATVRLRLYAWQYAAEIWQTRPMLGAGAACYTRFATQYSARDRFLDPAAFLGDWLEHAHNEFFEVFAEIGLFGGVSFVAAWVALLAAASRLLRSGLSAERRWLIIGVTAAIAAVLGDGLFGIALRLPGGAALFWTLVGALLAACRCAARPAAPESAPHGDGPGTATTSAAPRQHGLRRVGPIAASAMAAVMLLVAALGNFVGLVYERLAYRSYFANADFGATIETGRLASDLLLTPTRVLFAEELTLRARFARLQERVQRLGELPFADASQPASAPGSSPPNPAAQRLAGVASSARAAYEDALRLERRAPMMPGAAVLRARAAELLAAIHAESNPPAAAEWAAVAEATWLFHREQRRSDVETLLALTRYAKTLDEYVRNLRDALRAGFATHDWHAALRRIAREPGLDDSLGRMLAVAGPIDARTEPDALVASFAPEAHRLYAFVLGSRGEFERAADEALLAANLYRPVRARFPTLAAVARFERAEYLLRSNPQQAAAAAAELDQALRALPEIQPQQRAELEAPFHELLALCRLAQGDEPGALAARVDAGGDPGSRAVLLADGYVRLAEMFVRFPPQRRPAVDPWLSAALRHRPQHIRAWSWRAWLAADAGDITAVHAVLRAAEQAGLAKDALTQIVTGLQQEFPTLGTLTPAPP